MTLCHLALVRCGFFGPQVAVTRAALGPSSLAPQEGWQLSTCKQRLKKEVGPTGQTDREASLSKSETGELRPFEDPELRCQNPGVASPLGSVNL